ncbi:MAG: exodeoxyribonuclease VII small subunit [Lachnospiraceae bacterium]|nr:exodeoxyribonuclease VII small subunit [Lachnospiraceae bacterium]
MAEKKKENLEENFKKIEELLHVLESEETTLEQSFQYYEQGMKLLKQCNETIDRVEKKVLKLNEDGGLSELEG